jgi:outer membrane protein
MLTVLAMALALAPGVLFAQGKVAVVNVEQAILQTDAAQGRLAQVRNDESYKADKSEFDRLKEDLDELVKDFQKDAAVMSQEQQLAARKRLASKQADLEHVAGKLQQAEQATGQALLQEMSPMVQEVLRELISTEGIGLLLQRGSVIHADPGYSITAKVTDKLNQLATSN